MVFAPWGKSGLKGSSGRDQHHPCSGSFFPARCWCGSGAGPGFLSMEGRKGERAPVSCGSGLGLEAFHTAGNVLELKPALALGLVRGFPLRGFPLL